MLQNVSHAPVQYASARSVNGAPAQGDVQPEPLAMTSNLLSPRSVLVHCFIARSDTEPPVQGHIWLALHWILRKPVLCLKPPNGPIDFFFLRTFAAPERDTSGRGWHLVSKSKVPDRAGEFISYVIRLFPVTSQTICQQLDDVIAAIRGLATRVLAEAEFQHLMASPDDDERFRHELPTFPIQSSVQHQCLKFVPRFRSASRTKYSAVMMTKTMSSYWRVPFGNSTIQSVSPHLSQLGIGEY